MFTYGDLDLARSMEDVEDQHAQQQNINRAVKLPPFWPANAAAWFRTVEGTFELRGIVDERSRFFNTLHALPETTVVLIADLVEAEPLPPLPFTELRRRLLTAHQLTDMQRVEQLNSLPPMGAQKPSELLAEMIRLCPRGQENNAFFNCLYLSKLPRELRILLSEAEMGDKQALGARADQFWAHNSRLPHDVVAAVRPAAVEQEDDGAVAAVRPGKPPQRGGSKQKRGGYGGPGRGGGGRQATHALTHAEQARMGTGLCRRHFQFGADAHSCEAPCNWSGN